MLVLAIAFTACDQGGGSTSSAGGSSSAPEAKSRGNVIHLQQLEAKGATYDVWIAHDQGLLIAGAQKQGSERRSIHTFATTDAKLADQTGMPRVTDTSSASITLVPPSSAQISIGGTTTAIQLK